MGGAGFCQDPGIIALKVRALVLRWCFISLQLHHLFLSSATGGFLSAVLTNVSTTRLDAALTYMQVFLAYTRNKADTDVLLGSFPSQSAHPHTTSKYLETPMSTRRLVLVLFFLLSSEEARAARDTLCLMGLQDLGLQNTFSTRFSLSLPPSLPKRSVHVGSLLNILLPSVPHSRDEHTVLWLHCDLYCIFWR